MMNPFIPAHQATYLFSIDLEDVRLQVENGEQYQERVPENTRRYLAWLRTHEWRCTFFVVGDVAERHPDLIKEISDQGHEIASHGYRHVPLDQLDPHGFQEGIEKSLDAFQRIGIGPIRGYRAPTFSLTQKTSWVYPILHQLGFSYSSSVLPARNPLYGWPGFGCHPRRIDEGILEFPMSTGRFLHLYLPFAGGLYFRVLPRCLLSRAFRSYRLHTRAPLLGYFHPYDIDVEQERFFPPGVGRNYFYYALMYMNRSSVLDKLNCLLEDGYRICTYQKYLESEMAHGL